MFKEKLKVQPFSSIVCETINSTLTTCLIILIRRFPRAIRGGLMDTVKFYSS